MCFHLRDFKVIHAKCQQITLYFKHIGYKSLEKIQVYTDVYAVHEINSGGSRREGGLMEYYDCRLHPKNIKGQEKQS